MTPGTVLFSSCVFGCLSYSAIGERAASTATVSKVSAQDTVGPGNSASKLAFARCRRTARVRVASLARHAFTLQRGRQSSLQCASR
jgi:hypothetical protein